MEVLENNMFWILGVILWSGLIILLITLEKASIEIFRNTYMIYKENETMSDHNHTNYDTNRRDITIKEQAAEISLLTAKCSSFENIGKTKNLTKLKLSTDEIIKYRLNGNLPEMVNKLNLTFEDLTDILCENNDALVKEIERLEQLLEDLEL